VRPPRGQRSAGRTPRPRFVRDRSSSGAPKRAGFSLFGILGRIIAALVLGWSGGFLWFSLTLPAPAPIGLRTDAVVVLTGGKGRLKRGLAVIEAGSARRMLVSGVDRNTTRKQLAAAAGVKKSRLGTSDLGYEAVDTQSNAKETMRWVAKNGFTSIRLVTSAGHMRRARLELSRVLPSSVTVVSDAVAVEAKAPSIATEYSKYLLRRAALAMGEA